MAYKTTITIAPVLLHPKSTGEVKLKSSNPLDEPIIDPKYLSNKDDVFTLIKGKIIYFFIFAIIYFIIIEQFYVFRY